LKLVPETVGDHVRVYLKNQYGTAFAASRALGISASYLSSVANGRKPPNQQLLDLIGWERVVVFRPKEPA
jgi:hypothetical protein